MKTIIYLISFLLVVVLVVGAALVMIAAIFFWGLWLLFVWALKTIFRHS